MQISDKDICKSAKTFVIIGGGAAGAVAAESIRKTGFKGTIKVICSEPHLPIDRIKLSKVLDQKAEKITLFKPMYLDQLKIEFLLSKARPPRSGLANQC